MYNGHGAAYFAVYLLTDTVTPVKEIYLHTMVTNRVSKTLLQRVVREYENPLTRKIYQKADGFRIHDEITIVNNNFRGTVNQYATKEGTPATRSEFYNAIELLT